MLQANNPFAPPGLFESGRLLPVTILTLLSVVIIAVAICLFIQSRQPPAGYTALPKSEEEARNNHATPAGEGTDTYVSSTDMTAETPPWLDELLSSIKIPEVDGGKSFAGFVPVRKNW